MKLAIVVPGLSAHANDWAIPALQTLVTSLAQKHEVHVFSLRYPTQGFQQFGNFTHIALAGGVNKKRGAGLKLRLQHQSSGDD